MPRKKTTPVDVDNQQTIDETVVEEQSTSVAKSLTGKVVGCEKLNVRISPVAGSKPVCVIDKDAVVAINEKDSTKDWYAVDVNPHTSGYCMKQFIAIEQ